MFTCHREGGFAFIQRGKQEHQKPSVGMKLCKKAKEANLTKAVDKKKKEKLVITMCFSCGKKGHLLSKYPQS